MDPEVTIAGSRLFDPENEFRMTLIDFVDFG
jgi:hypothetical protein